MITVMIGSASSPSPAAVDQLRVAVDAALGVVLSAGGPDTALREAWPYLHHAEMVLEQANLDEIDEAVALAVQAACHAVRAQNFGDARVALVTARGRLVRPNHSASESSGSRKV